MSKNLLISKFLNKHNEDVSENALFVIFITLCGGLQDSYSYIVRGKVFANAQTGNIVLMSQKIIQANFSGSISYLIPLLSFCIGVFIAQTINLKVQAKNKNVWKLLVLALEIFILFVVGFIPQKFNIIANSLVSLSCSMQIQAFKKINGYNYASTMCIGNMRSGVEALTSYVHTNDKLERHRAIHYFLVILVFALGAAIGALFAPILQEKLIIICCIFLTVSLILFIKEL
ncbi:YoaK family protein [Criibacterium bergeronii]|uniref:DUF1275 domain-containing protein n=1 Tax=Criibacterium bergeronii TaxID=1871336 RepID=A0A371IN78_9FIRM|nr:YoaK family protein [Criibacterium bergeronii]MBS6062582.1 DUF1275 domain-containing protein [Peptostreptococcaceae bacterium]RDY21937.1 DUF1275 domain-containing protein [Criibacterium bergeronii]TRW26862.1 DUF1275 domain-containing protein [Criibacterium bergeronii]